jgi:hypothetical protein
MPIIVNSGSTVTVTIASGLTITNASTVAAGGLLDGSGTIGGGFVLLNQGTISADQPGSTLTVNTGSLTNAGTIVANNATLSIQSSTTNLSGGTLTGGVWEATGTGVLALRTGPVVTDNATIVLNGTASTFDGFSSGTLQPIDNSLVTVGSAGSLSLLSGRDFQAGTSLVVNGTVTLGGGTLSAPTNGLTIGASGHLVGSGIIDPGTPVTDNGTIAASGGALTMPDAGNVIGTGTLIADAGASLVLQAFGSYAQSIVNLGTIDAAFSLLTGTLGITGPYSGNGGFLIEGGFDSADKAILELPASVSANVAFDTNYGELLLDSASSFNGTVTGFGNNDTLALSGVAGAVNAALSGNILQLTNGGGSLVETITLNTVSTNYSGASFHVSENGGNNKAIVTVTGAQAACFAAGTRIMTPAGQIPVEDLARNDVVNAHFAGAARIIWTGHRHVDCRRQSEPEKVWPVKVSADAFASGMPAQDLFLSPDHAIYFDGVLIPIRLLVNGKTIARSRVDEITYYHIQLSEHDVVLAEGMPAETYLEDDDRLAFDNPGDRPTSLGGAGIGRWESFGCARLLLTGAKLDAVMDRVNQRIPT